VSTTKEAATMKATLISLIVTTLVVTAAALALAARPAEALSVTGSGTPGVVSPGAYISATNVFPHNPEFVFGATDVYRSSAYAGTQVVTLTYRVWNKDATGWHLSQWNTRTSTLAPGYYTRFSANTFSLYEWNRYGADIRVQWSTPGGAVIATRTIDYDSTTDYRCSVNESFTKCDVTDNRDGLGAHVFFWYSM
jgi:hypothetical protein